MKMGVHDSGSQHRLDIISRVDLRLTPTKLTPNVYIYISIKLLYLIILSELPSFSVRF